MKPKESFCVMFLHKVSAVGDLSLKTTLRILYRLNPADTVVVIRSPGVAVSYQRRSTDTS